jgi:hypothetical protein
VQRQGRCDEEWLEGKGLVVGPGQEEIFIAGGYGTGVEGYERCVGNVEGGEDREGIRGVALDS